MDKIFKRPNKIKAMNPDLYDNLKDILTYLEENLKNYYFRKRYLRYDPAPEILNIFKNIKDEVKVVVLARDDCPTCIATIPMIIRLYLDSENPNISIKVIDNDYREKPDSFIGKESPFIAFYDNKFRQLFVLEEKDIKDNFESSLIENIENFSY